MASSQSHVGDLVKRKSAIASMLYEKALANAGIRRNNSEEAITQRCGLCREPLVGNVKRSHPNYYPIQAYSSIISLFFVPPASVRHFPLETSYVFLQFLLRRAHQCKAHHHNLRREPRVLWAVCFDHQLKSEYHTRLERVSAKSEP
jgi:hypothetical protein